MQKCLLIKAINSQTKLSGEFKRHRDIVQSGMTGMEISLRADDNAVYSFKDGYLC
jgi:hypothetical protein